jgi:cytosine/adenosine deaminase-related metal-dependent hydrolase
MRRWLRLLVIVVGLLAVAALAVWRALAPPAPLQLPAQGLVLSDVTLVEPGRARAANRRVVVEGGALAGISDAQPAAGDPFAGAFVLPGLNDLHAHFPPASIPGQTELFAFLFLYHGVTGVRDAGDVDGTASVPARQGVASGAFPGPRIQACGPFVDGDPPQWRNSQVVRTPEDGRRAVAEIARAGFGCVKAYNGLSEPALTAVREAAREHGLPVIGHVPRAVPFERALLDDAQHLIGVPVVLPDEPAFPFNQGVWETLDAARLDFVIETSLRHGLAHTPTLVTGERLVAMRDYERLREEPDAHLLPRFYRDAIWHPQGGLSPAGGMGPQDFDTLERALAAKLRAVKRMHDAGVRLHSGTDSLVAFVVPGAALHRELRLFVQAGLSPEQALAISTGASAEFLGVPGLGRLEPGAPAELAIFRDDPTASLDALDTLLGVVRDGRLYPRAALDAQLARHRDHFEGRVYDAVFTPLVRRAVAATLRR